MQKASQGLKQLPLQGKATKTNIQGRFNLNS